MLHALLVPGANLGAMLMQATGAKDQYTAAKIVKSAWPGGSNVHFKKPRQGGPFLYVGPLGGSPPGSYMVKSKSQILTVLRYSRHAAKPEALRLAVKLLFCEDIP